MKDTDIWHKWVVEYFNSTLLLYLLYSREHFHFGFWDEKTRTFSEALTNTTRCVADHLEIKENDVILDAGCGVGGSSRYIAANYPSVKIIGINISDAQVKKARDLSRRAKNRQQLEFQQQDFTRTNFPNASFTKIFAIESVCHTPTKMGFLKEAYRLLKDGGKLIVADGFLGKSFQKNLADKDFRSGLNAWSVAGFNTPLDFANKLRKAGFNGINYHDKRHAVIRTSWRLHRRAKRAYPFTFILSKFKFIPAAWHGNMKSSYIQKKYFEENVVTYGIFEAYKDG